MKNIVFYFSGTGNCLKAAKTIVKELGDGEIVSMAKPGSYKLLKQYDTIGFVYPAYFMGMPKKAAEFVKNMDFDGNKGAYVYVIGTCGGFAGSAIYETHKLLIDRHGIKVNYSKQLRMFSNYVVLYDMSTKVDEITQRSNKKLVSIIDAIKNRKHNKINPLQKILFFLKPNKEFTDMDRDYNVNNNCTGCGICGKVCPVKNIAIVNGRPQFNHKCEQCVACIQFCPQKAINYKNLTQNRGRYTHPEIDWNELAKYNN